RLVVVMIRTGKAAIVRQRRTCRSGNARHAAALILIGETSGREPAAQRLRNDSRQGNAPRRGAARSALDDPGGTAVQVQRVLRVISTTGVHRLLLEVVAARREMEIVAGL